MEPSEAATVPPLTEPPPANPPQTQATHALGASKAAKTAAPPPGSKKKTDPTIAFLRREADLAQERAKRLREFADSLEASQGAYETAPLDENGVPKYKGKKRGRKPRKRLRKRNPNAKKRSHTAYTLFVQETYPKVRKEYEEGNEFQSKNVISIVAKQWKDVPASEKEEWKRRAQELSGVVPDQDQGSEDEEDEDDDEDQMNVDVEEAMAMASASLAAEQTHEDAVAPAPQVAAVMEGQNPQGQAAAGNGQGQGAAEGGNSSFYKPINV